MRKRLLEHLKTRRRVRLFRRAWGQRRIEEFVDVTLDVRDGTPMVWHLGSKRMRDLVIEQKLAELNWAPILIAIFMEFLLPLIIEWLNSRDAENAAA